MTGIQLPTPPTERRQQPEQPSIEYGPVAPPATATGSRSPLLIIAVMVLGTIAVVLGALLFAATTGRADGERLAADNERITADVERLTTENERLTAANEELAAEMRAWEEEFFGWEEFEPGEAVALFTAGPSEELVVERAALYTFDAEAGGLLELAVADDGYFSFELTDDAGRYVGFADIGSFPDEEFWGEGPSDRAWFVLDRDGPYQLSVYGGGMYGPPEEAAGVLLAQLHAPAGGVDLVVDVAEPYPVDGELPVHTFDGQAGQLAIVTMTSERAETLDPFVRLYGPDGALLGRDDDGAGGLDARLVVRLPEDGRYEVEADSYDYYAGRPSSRETGYTLTVELTELG
jgi:outer membrane murein-binding lipoprotein Lpp